MKKFYAHFLKSLAFVTVLCLAVGFIPKTGLAQQNSNLIIVVDLMKVKPGDEAKYVDLEQKIWKPIHQERISQGILVGWILYEVMYTGTDDSYNYATVNVYADPAILEAPYAGIDFNKIHPGLDINEEIEETLSARKTVKSQLMSRVNFAYPGGGESPGPHKYIVVNYMKSKPGGNFVEVENSLAKPTAAELIKNGDWAGWSVWSNVFPRGDGMESDFVTVDYYLDMLKLNSANYMEAFQKAHPDIEWSEFAEKIGNSRDMVRTELWKILDSAFAE